MGGEENFGCWSEPTSCTKTDVMNGKTRLRLEFMCSHFAAAGLFQCINICILNGKTRLRLEFIVCNGHQGLTLGSWSLHSSWTVPMHQHMYIEWQAKIENGIHCLQWSPGADFGVMGE
eukprot:scaffold50160_cov36-Cyclotella_meneghiniana.AAC.1